MREHEIVVVAINSERVLFESTEISVIVNDELST